MPNWSYSGPPSIGHKPLSLERTDENTRGHRHHAKKHYNSNNKLDKGESLFIKIFLFKIFILIHYYGRQLKK